MTLLRVEDSSEDFIGAGPESCSIEPSKSSNSVTSSKLTSSICMAFEGTESTSVVISL